MSSIDVVPPHNHGSESCQTRQPGVQPLDQDAFRKIVAFIDRRISSKVSIEDLSALARMGRHHFSRRFKLKASLPPHAFIVKRRMDLARRLLERTNLSCEQIAEQVGFTNMGHFRTQFRKHHGKNPSDVRLRLTRTSSQLDLNERSNF